MTDALRQQLTYAEAELRRAQDYLVRGRPASADDIISRVRRRLDEAMADHPIAMSGAETGIDG
jgi:hypothetical protein